MSAWSGGRMRWVGYLTALLVLGGALFALARPRSASRGARERAVRAVPSRSDSESVAPPVVLPSATAPLRPADVELPVRAPQEIEESPDRLREWLLALPLERLRTIVATPTLDRYVGRVVDAMARRRQGPEPAPGLGEFLMEINGRIRMATR